MTSASRAGWSSGTSVSLSAILTSRPCGSKPASRLPCSGGITRSPAAQTTRTGRSKPGSREAAATSSFRFAATDQDRLGEQVVGAVDVVEQHLARRARGPGGAPEREVRQPVHCDVVDDAVE